MKTELVDCKAGEEEQRAHEKKTFLEYKVFFDLMDSHSAVLFEYDFEEPLNNSRRLTILLKGCDKDHFECCAMVSK